MEQQFDVVIVGAGITGALTAAKIATDGHSVLMLEAGPAAPERLSLVDSYVTAAKKDMAAPYRLLDPRGYAPSANGPDDYYDHTGSQDRFKATFRRMEGGSTWHWRGNVPRFVPNDFRIKSVYGVGVDWPLSYGDLEADYCEGEREMGVSGDHEAWNDFMGAYRSEPFPMPHIWPAYGDTVVARNLRGVEYRGIPINVMTTPQARNSQPYNGRPPCAGNSTCDPICPIEAKYDGSIHVRQACDAGAVLSVESVATRLIVGEDDTIVGVTYKNWDGSEHLARGRLVVLAAHAIEIPKLLLMSACERAPNGVANRSDQVGRNLMDHLQGQGAALLPEPVYPFRGPPTTSGVDSFRDGFFRSESAAFRMSVGNDGWGRVRGPYGTVLNLVRSERLFGRELRDRLRYDATRQFRMSYSTETLPDPGNRVTLSGKRDALGIPRPHIHFTIPDYNKRGFEMARGVIDTVFDALRATQRTFAPTTTDDFSAANHIMGTTRMGLDPRDSVVNPDGRSHDHRNLFVLGSSVFPTAGTANPTLTLVALALRSIRAMKADFK